MKVAIIGTGKMGRGFTAALARKHEVTVGSRDRDRAAAIASKVGVARGATYADAAADADVVILTIPWEAMEETLPQLGDLKGTVVIDVSYPYNKREREALKDSSTAEEIQKRLPNARVCKGWNHVHARHLTDPEVDGIAASVLIAGRPAPPRGRTRDHAAPDGARHRPGARASLDRAPDDPGGIFDGEHRFQIEEAGPSRVRFIQSERFGGVLLPFLWRRLREGGTAKGFRAMNDALAQRVTEQRQGAT